MHLSVTGYNEYVSNRERYRCSHKMLGNGVVPVTVPEAMARGISLHTFAEGYFKGWTRDQVVQKLEEAVVEEKEIERGEAMWPVLRDYLNSLGLEVLAVEPEFCIPLGGKLEPHYLVGKIDLIARQGGEIKVYEYKGTNPKKRVDDVEKEWRAATQATTEIAGARALGHAATAMEVIHVVEEVVPYILGGHGHLVQRTDYEIEYMLRSFAQTADTIVMLEREWGVDEPWPHDIHTIWASDMRGSCNNGWCDYKDICGCVHLTMPEGFKEKPDYLEVVKELKLAAKETQ